MLVAVLLLFAWQKVHDTDVWLHLGLGKYMVEHQALPPGDVFTFTSYGKPYEYFEWLFQCSLYLLYSYLGYDGLMVFKLGLWFLTLGFLWQWMKVEGVESRWAAVFTLFPAIWLADRWKERPEIAGFFFLALYLWVLCRYRHGGGNYLYCLPWLQILWINLHPSALLGIAVFLVILVGEGFDYLFDYLGDKNKGDPRVLKALLIIIPLLLGVSFINPYGYKLVFEPFIYSAQMAGKKTILEWRPVWHFQPLLIAYLTFLIPAALSFILRFRRPRENLKLSDLFLFVFGSALPFISARYIAVFAIIALPVAAKNFYWCLSRWEGARQWTAKSRPRERMVRWALPAAVFLLGGLLFWIHPQTNFRGWGPERMVIPQEAVAFIQNNSMPGPIFNEYEMGGYLIFAAYPRYLAFIDSRAFDEEIFQEYRLVAGAKPGWEEKLKQRRINLIMINALTLADNGAIWPLVLRLFQDPGWVLVWSQKGTLVFLKNQPENQKWLEKFSLPKALIFEEIIFRGKFFIDKCGPTSQAYNSLAWAYLSQGNFGAAKKAFEEQLRLSPKDEEAQRYLDFLARQGY